MSFTVLGVGRWVSPPVFGRRKGGFPPGGPWDRESFDLACALSRSDRAFELDTGRLTFAVSGWVACVGVGRAETVWIEAGEGVESGRRMYIAPLTLPLAAREDKGSFRLAEFPPRAAVVRLLPGPQPELLDRLLGREFMVSRLSDRTGIRLQPATESHGIGIPSEPATFGAIQVTPDGTPIVLGPDGPTIGGYPKPAVVIRADRDLLGRLMPGDPLRFALCERDEADRLFEERRAKTARKLVEIGIALNARGFSAS